MFLNWQNPSLRAKAKVRVHDHQAGGNERRDVNKAPPSTAEKERPT